MNPRDPALSPGIGLPPAQFAAAFPFHLAVNRQLNIVQTGSTLGRICPDAQVGASLSGLFQSLQPNAPLTWARILENRSRFFLLQHRATSLQLRGEFLSLPGEETLVFLGSPWFTDAAEITARGLGFSDFAIHDPVIDLLQVSQATKIALADAKQLANKLTAQRAELRTSNERLRQQEAETRKLALIAAHTDNAVILTDAAGATVWVNEGFTRLTGYTLAELVGRRPGLVLQGTDTDTATVQRIREHLQRGEGFKEELLNYAKDGRRYWVAIEVQPIHDDHGQLTNFMAIESDITERKRTARELLQSKEAAEAANRAKSDFLAVMSHEIRTPLNAMLGMTQQLLETQLNDQQTGFAQSAAHSGEVLLEIINDILDLSKVEAGEQFQLKVENFSLRRLLDSLIAVLRPTATRRGLTLTHHVDIALPDARRGDAGRLRQVLLNLVGNALKFTDAGEVSVHVQIPAPAGDAAASPLRFEVRDTGIGISPAHRPRLFEPFVQVDSSASRHRGGTGLGLAISKRFVELMGGRIGVESSPGQGSTFWFELLLPGATSVAAETTPPAAPSLLQAGTSPASLPKPAGPTEPPRRILVAEDHETNRQLVSAMLERLGHSATFASNGHEAIAAWESQDPDIILMDCRMPGMDGFDASREIRRREAARPAGATRRVRIIALTANALRGDRELCLAAGMDDYLSKPCTSRQLKAALAGPALRTPPPAPGDALVPVTTPGFDPRAPAQLGAELGEEYLRSIVEDFLKDLPTRVAEIQGLAAVGNHADLARVAHSLQGIGLSLGLNGFSALLLNIETAANTGQKSSIAAAIQAWSTAADAVPSILRGWLAAQTP